MVLVGVALLGTGIALLLTKKPPQIASVPPSATPQPAPPASVIVRVESTPAGAHVFVGGADRGPAPLDVKLARGAAPVEIELRREGYAPLREKIVPDVDQRMRLNMTALPYGRSAADRERPAVPAIRLS